MTLRSIIILTISICLILSGCSYFNNSKDDINSSLIGTWALDSVSTSYGQYVEMGGSTLTFINNTDYSEDWSNGDVGNTNTGKYFILDNPKRGLQTISFIPDIQIAGKDTIRIEYMNFDLVSINSKRLQVVAETEFVKSDSSPYIRFNKNSIYKRIK